MVPRWFVQLDALPLTPNGKVDRRALPAPAARGPRRLRRPRTELEAAIAAIWADVLGLEQVGIHDDFFDLGGHSLLAIKVISRIAAAHRTARGVRQFFEAPTVRSVTQRLTASTALAPGAQASWWW